MFGDVGFCAPQGQALGGPSALTNRINCWELSARVWSLSQWRTEIEQGNMFQVMELGPQLCPSHQGSVTEATMAHRLWTQKQRDSQSPLGGGAAALTGENVT